MDNHLKGFKLASFRFHLEPNEPLHLPPYLGSTLRGGFGNVFKRVVCISPERNCSACLLRGNCAYSYIFETHRSEGVKAAYELSEYPHPFIIEPPLGSKYQYKPGDELTFGLILIGKAIDYLPYFVFVYQELGRTGIGKGRGKYTLKKVESIVPVCRSTSRGEPTTVFDSQSQTLFANFQVRSFADFIKEPRKSLSLEFITPTRIKHQGRLTKAIDFQILMRNLLRRTMLLSELHCSQKLELDFTQLLKEAQAIKTVQSELHWQDWERYSSRQQSRMKLGGFVGLISFEGELKGFMPFIKLANIST